MAKSVTKTLRDGKKGTDCPNKRNAHRRLTAEQVALARDPNINMSALAREIGVSNVAVFYARHKFTYRDLP